MVVTPYEHPADRIPQRILADPRQARTEPTSTFAPRGTDAIARMTPPWLGFGSSGDPFFGGSLIAQLGTLLSQLGSFLTQLFGGGSNGGLSFGRDRFYPNATGASVGDPHLSFNNNRWDSMASHADLLHSDSFPGGFQLSTEVTQPDANGITSNKSATIRTNWNSTSITLNKDGSSEIFDGGQSINVAAGSTAQLSNGETVTRNQDGSLQVACTSPYGGHINTTMRVNGNGIDVSVDANSVDLGGDLARS